MVDAGHWGLEPGYHDTAGRWREVPAETTAAVLGTMGAGGVHPDDDPGLILTVRLDHPLPPVPAGVLVLEDGAEVRTGGPLPPDLPVGYHRLRPDRGPERTLVVSPGRCPEPPGSRWGWSVQLYAARSSRSWGIGDLGDLAEIARWGRSTGAGLTLLNPLHAGPQGPHREPSPYFPSSRCFADPLYLRVEDVDGATGAHGLESVGAAGRALNAGRRIDRDEVWALKSEALERIFDSAGPSRRFDLYRRERGRVLEGFATFNAIAERHGLPWQSWPEEFRHPGSAAVRRFAASPGGGRRIRYHAWLQWQLERQLEAGADGLIADLAVGVGAGGADAWLWQETFAGGMTVGAPPDDFNRLGQDWGLPPWDPWRLRAAGYTPFVETVRAAFRHAGGLRVDHVMGLFRLFWIPSGSPPDAGAYVRYPYWDLLNILALEAHRAGAFVVGEDLGTVEDRVRAELAEREVLSYRLLWFEPSRPAHWPRQALGAVTTHDLPTVVGLWSGEDLAVQRRLGLEPNEEGSESIKGRLRDWSGLAAGAGPEEVVAGAYGLLSEAPCSILTVSLDDLAVVTERPNMPGTVDEWPNWSIALPVPIEELQSSALASQVASRMNGGPRS